MNLRPTGDLHDDELDPELDANPSDGLADDDDFADGEEDVGENEDDNGDDIKDDDDDDHADFPRGDGTAETDAVVYCPHCGESVEIALDPGGGSFQRYVEDCEVCCRPWNVSVRYDEEGAADVSLEPLDD